MIVSVSSQDPTAYAIVLQVQPEGSVTHVGIVVDPSKSLGPLEVTESITTLGDGTPAVPDPAHAPIEPDQTLAPLDPPATPSDAFQYMLARLDMLCEQLGNTLREVVLAFSFPHATATVDLRDYMQVPGNANLLDVLRSWMPCMVERQCLVVHREQSDASFDEVIESVFQRDARLWTNVKLYN